MPQPSGWGQVQTRRGAPLAPDARWWYGSGVYQTSACPRLRPEAQLPAFALQAPRAPAGPLPSARALCYIDDGVDTSKESLSVYQELRIFSGNAHPDLALAICDYLETPPGRCEVFQFSNENIFVRFCGNLRD